MNLLSRIREALGGKPALRNKPGGLAWINAGANEGEGSDALVNRVVKTVRLLDSGGHYWAIDPPQMYTLTGYKVDSQGMYGRPGDRCRVNGLHDDVLTPIQGNVSDEEVRELYLTPKQPEPAHA